MTATNQDGPTDIEALVESELRPSLAAGTLVLDQELLEGHSSDEALFCPADGAIALVRATCIEDVQATLRFASAHRVPVVPQGPRSGISGGANAVPGCLLLSVERMSRILSVDPAERTVTVEPGVLNQDLKNALAQHNLAYPPDPGSVAISSIGGNVATNAGGLCCVKYGVTRDYVRQLRVVLVDGTIATLGAPTAKGVAGLDLCTLFVGSEGTLGVIVEITLSLIPSLAEPLTGVATFTDEREAAATVADFMESGARPPMTESLDRVTVALLNEYGSFGLDDRAGAMLLMQSDGDGNSKAALAEVESFTASAKANGALEVVFSDDAAENKALVATRRAARPAYEKYAQSHGGGQLLDDICLRRSRMPEFYRRLEHIRAQSGLTIGTVAHAGDGNIHPSVFFDTDDPADVSLAHGVFREIMQLGLELGGTIEGNMETAISSGTGFRENLMMVTGRYIVRSRLPWTTRDPQPGQGVQQSLRPNLRLTGLVGLARICPTAPSNRCRESASVNSIRACG